MTLHPQAVYTEPEDTARVARAAFPKGTLCLRLHDELGLSWLFIHPRLPAGAISGAVPPGQG